MLNAIFSGLYWAFFAVSAFLLYLLAVLICALTAPFDPARSLLHRYTCWWGQLYLRCLPGCRIVVEDRHKIAPGTPYVLVANHQSLTDIMALSALALPFKWVSKQEAFKLPCIGWNMYLNQYISVDRGNIRSVRQTMERCRYWLKRQLPLMMFPEGHRSPDGEIKEFHGGSFKLAVESGCAAVPIVVDGTWPIYRGWRVMAFPGRVTIRVLDPVTPAEVGGQADKLRREVFGRMKQALAEIREQKSREPAVVPS